MSPSRGLPAGSVTRQRRRFRSCSIDITAYRPAGIEQLDALMAAEGKGTLKQESPVDLDQAEVRAVLSFMSDLDGRFRIAATDDDDTRRLRIIRDRRSRDVAAMRLP